MKTHHNKACVMGFGRVSPKGVCPRCDELRKGTSPIRGWGYKQQRGRKYDDQGRAIVRETPD